MTAFAITPIEILSAPDLNRLDQSVFIALKSHARPNKPLVWPSRTRLARLVGCSLASVSRSLKRLAAAGWILIKRTGRANRVTVFDSPPSTSNVLPASHRIITLNETSEIPPLPPEGVLVSVVIDQDTHDHANGDGDQDATITPDQAAFLIAYMNSVTGSHLDPNAKPLVRLVNRRLRHYSQAQLQIAILYYFGIWKGTAMEPHARNIRTILSPTRIEFALSEHERMGDQDKAQSPAIWKPEPEKPRDKETAKSALAGLRKILNC